MKSLSERILHLVTLIEALERENEQLKKEADTKAITMIYGYAGLITSLKEPVTFSENHWATPAADIAAAIIEANGLTGECDFDNYVSCDYGSINNLPSGSNQSRSSDCVPKCIDDNKQGKTPLVDAAIYNKESCELTPKEASDILLYAPNWAECLVSNIKGGEYIFAIYDCSTIDGFLNEDRSKMKGDYELEHNLDDVRVAAEEVKDNEDGPVVRAAKAMKSLGDAMESMKPVYTQEMYGKGELPSVGMKCRLQRSITCIEVVTVIADTPKFTIVSHDEMIDSETVISKLLGESLQPFDTRTPEQKQVDKVSVSIGLIGALNEKLSVSLAEHLQASGLLKDIS